MTGVVYSVSNWESSRHDDRDPQRPPQLSAHPSSHGQRDSAQQGRHGRHHDGGETARGTPVNASRGFIPCCRSASSAKSIIIMAFFLHDADQQDDADQRDHAQVDAANQEREDGPHAGRRQGREDRDRVDVAFVKHAQDDVHGHEGRQDQ